MRREDSAGAEEEGIEGEQSKERKVAEEESKVAGEESKVAGEEAVGEKEIREKAKECEGAGID